MMTSTLSAQVGTRYPSERKIIPDAVTGYPMIVLTNGKQSDSKIYQTHPQWTADGKYIIFRSAGRAPGSQAYAVNEKTGDIIQLTEGPGLISNSLNIAQKSMKLYYIRHVSVAPASDTPATTQKAPEKFLTKLIELDLAKLFADSEAGTLKPGESYERICATLPADMRDGGGIALDADETTAYLSVNGGDVGTHLPPGVAIQDKPPGARMGAGPGGLRAIDLATGRMRVIIDTPFQIGHVQTNPWVSGEIVYCHETGGDAPQRMWTVRADGTGNRPLFVENPNDWVTHEAVVTRDEVMFNLIGHTAKLRQHPTGIAVINLRTDAVQLLGQVTEQVKDGDFTGPGGFWHCNGSADGKWAVGDTFLGNVWLINRQSGKMTLLSTDHKMKPDHTHPTFDPTGKKILIQSGHFTDGKRLSLVVLPIPNDL